MLLDGPNSIDRRLCAQLLMDKVLTNCPDQRRLQVQHDIRKIRDASSMGASKQGGLIKTTASDNRHAMCSRHLDQTNDTRQG